MFAIYLLILNCLELKRIAQEDLIFSTIIFDLRWLRPSKHSSLWRRLEKVLKSSFIFAFRRLFQKVLLNIFALVIRLQETSSRRLAKILQGVFKKYDQVKLFLLTRLWNVFKTFLSLSAITVIYGRICRSHFWEIYVQCTKFVRVIKFLKF